MDSKAKLMGFTPILSTNPDRSSRWIALCALLVLAAVTVGCGAASQTGNARSSQSTSLSTSQIAITVPASAGKVGVPYNAVASVSGGQAPYIFSVSKGGSLPPGLSLNPLTGTISGVPTVAGDYSFTLTVADVPHHEVGSFAARILIASAVVSDQSAKISVSPGTTTVPSQGTQRFTASVTGTSNTAVVWSATSGTISSSGQFTAPKVSSNTSVTITATGATDGSLHAAAVANVTPAAALAITTSVLPESNVGISYNAPLSATGGTLPHQWSLSSGTLPAGIQLEISGAVVGTTSVSGSYTFTAKVSDSAGNSSSRAFTLSVSSLSASGFDGPAELPRVYIQTAVANTPAPGTTITVNSGGNLQSALNSANCGDTVSLQAGATFTGVFTFPAKSCDDNHWIMVRTGADDSTLPAEGSRLTPCYAGVSSLPGRPAFQCISTTNVLAKLVMAANGDGPVVFASGANHYRLIGLEITRTARTGLVNALSSVAANGTANNLIFDRVWMHGSAQDETTRGVGLGGTTYLSIVDSFFTDFHCISVTGSCGDAQAIVGGMGDSPMGPYKITDNFLEASGENILFGGGEATATPADIEISHNHLFKPLTWMKGQTGYVGGSNGNPFVVKNLIELKNAQRLLIDGNIMEGAWGGFSQVGFAILLTPKNQAGPNGTNLCSDCQVTDVTIRNSMIRHVGAGMQIANGLSDNGGAALAGQRYSIHDVIIDDINGVKYNGPGEFAQVSMGLGAPVLQNVTINHVTAFPPSMQFVIGAQLSSTTPMTNFVFTNNIVNAGTYPVWSNGNGDTANCAYHDSPLTTFKACFTSYTFSHNAIIASPANAIWPSGNFFPTLTAVHFVNDNVGIGGDYHLQTSSPYKGAATDGRDLGADVDAVDAAIAGVE